MLTIYLPIVVMAATTFTSIGDCQQCIDASDYVCVDGSLGYDPPEGKYCCPENELGTPPCDGLCFHDEQFAGRFLEYAGCSPTYSGCSHQKSMSFSDNDDEEYSLTFEATNIHEDDVCIIWIKDADKEGNTRFRFSDFVIEDVDTQFQIFHYDYKDSSFTSSFEKVGYNEFDTTTSNKDQIVGIVLFPTANGAGYHFQVTNKGPQDEDLLFLLFIILSYFGCYGMCACCIVGGIICSAKCNIMIGSRRRS